MASSLVQTNDLGALASGNQNVNLIDADFQQLITAVNTLKTFSNYYVDLGSANTLAITVPSPQIVTVVAGVPFQIKVAATNTGASTLNVTAGATPLGPVSIVNPDGSALYYGELNAGGIHTFMYDGTNFQLLNQTFTSNLDYKEFTAPVTINATTEATANPVATADPVVFNGTTAVMIEFFAPFATPSTGDTITFALFDGSTSLGQLGQVFSGAGVVTVPVLLKRQFTPSNASHTYSVRGYATTNPGAVAAGGGGGAGNKLPGYIRISRT